MFLLCMLFSKYLLYISLYLYEDIGYKICTILYICYNLCCCLNSSILHYYIFFLHIKNCPRSLISTKSYLPIHSKDVEIGNCNFFLKSNNTTLYMHNLLRYKELSPKKQVSICTNRGIVPI